ncbi:MAG: arylsulfotransferase family protein [Halobacteriaceae archaeon]
MQRGVRGAALVAAGVLLFVGTIGVSAVTAPDVTVESDGDGLNETLVGSQGGGPGLHEDGSVYLVRGTNRSWRLFNGTVGSDSYFDVTRLDNGTVLAGFIDGGYEECGEYSVPCKRTGFRILSPPPDPEIRYEYSYPVREIGNRETHDVEVLDSGEFLLTDMDRERLVAVEDGEVTWQWNASSRYDSPLRPTRTDWLHINDVDVIDEGRYLLSVRNANQLLVIERGEGVVEVINRDDGGSDETCRSGDQLKDYDNDGDVLCGDPGVLNHQHNPQSLGDGHVLVADSENNRVVELARTADGDWEPAWTLESAGSVPFDWPRDADRLPNGNTLITDTMNQRIVEVNETGVVVWSVETPLVPYEADRLPEGEVVGAPAYAVNESATTAASGRSLLGLPVCYLHFVLPWLPLWFTELQFFLSLFSVVLVVSGVYDALRAWL